MKVQGGSPGSSRTGWRRLRRLASLPGEIGDLQPLEKKIKPACSKEGHDRIHDTSMRIRDQVSPRSFRALLGRWYS